MFLRKALAISEKYKDTTLSPYDKADALDSSRIDKRNVSADLNISVPKSDLLYDTDLKSHYIDEKLDSDELNSISTILYDLGCLLSVNKSEILRKEGIDFMRRCLDIKILMYDANHVECQIIKSQLTNNEIKNNTFLNEEFFLLKKNKGSSNQPMPTLLRRSNTSVSITPRDKTLRSLEYLRKQIRNDKNNEKMLSWITRNSLLETIKPVQKAETEVRQQGVNSHLQSSEYLNNSSLKNNSLISNGKTRLLASRIPSSYSVTGRRQDSRTVQTPHQQICYIPTAFSVDIHNSASIHGPHSSVKDILSESLKDKTVHKPHSAILKPIYYKSAWYDRPIGSSKKRFKHFLKLSPNSNQQINNLKTNNETISTIV